MKRGRKGRKEKKSAKNRITDQIGKKFFTNRGGKSKFGRYEMKLNA